MTNNLYDRPLQGDEFVELDELLAHLDENNLAMDAAEADGFLTALHLLPEEVAPSIWMPMIFSASSEHKTLLPQKDQDKLEMLIYRRYREIGHLLSQCKPIDPIVFDPEDELGNILSGEDSIIALEPFASGFLTVAQAWPGLLDTDNEALASALVGIWRHLPQELMGDFEEIRLELLSESPLEDLDDAIADLATSITEVAAITRGFLPKQRRPQPTHRKHFKSR